MAQASSKTENLKGLSEKDLEKRIGEIVQRNDVQVRLMRASIAGVDLSVVAQYELLRLVKEHNMSAIAFVLKNNIR